MTAVRGNALAESVKVAKRCRQRERRIFVDQGGDKAGDTTDEVGGQSVKERGEGGGTECAVPVGNDGYPDGFYGVLQGPL